MWGSHVRSFIHHVLSAYYLPGAVKGINLLTQV